MGYHKQRCHVVNSNTYYTYDPPTDQDPAQSAQIPLDVNGVDLGASADKRVKVYSDPQAECDSELKNDNNTGFGNGDTLILYDCNEGTAANPVPFKIWRKEVDLGTVTGANQEQAEDRCMGKWDLWGWEREQ